MSHLISVELEDDVAKKLLAALYEPHGTVKGPGYIVEVWLAGFLRSALSIALERDDA